MAECKTNNVFSNLRRKIGEKKRILQRYLYNTLIEVSGNFYGRLLCVDISLLTFYMCGYCPLDRAIIDYILPSGMDIIDLRQVPTHLHIVSGSSRRLGRSPNNAPEIKFETSFSPQLIQNRTENGKPLILVFV